jgi:hypothetical protein
MNEKLIEFLRTKPPTFGGSVNPLDADDWLRAILRELEPFNCEDRDKVLLATHQLTGTALACGKTTMQQPRIPPPSLGMSLWKSFIATTSQKPR